MRKPVYKFTLEIPALIEVTNFICTDPDVQYSSNFHVVQTTLDVGIDEDVVCTFTTQESDLIFFDHFEGL